MIKTILCLYFVKKILSYSRKSTLSPGESRAWACLSRASGTAFATNTRPVGIFGESAGGAVAGLPAQGHKTAVLAAPMMAHRQVSQLRALYSHWKMPGPPYEAELHQNAPWQDDLPRFSSLRWPSGNLFVFQFWLSRQSSTCRHLVRSVSW